MKRLLVDVGSCKDCPFMDCNLMECHHPKFSPLGDRHNDHYSDFHPSCPLPSFSLLEVVEKVMEHKTEALKTAKRNNDFGNALEYSGACSALREISALLSPSILKTKA